MGKHVFNDITNQIIKAAIEVHRYLGPGFQEVVYQRSLFHEMHLRSMDFSREPEIEVFFKDRLVGKRRVDFIVEDCLVEIKAKDHIEDKDCIQTLSYLRASKKKIALLINFGEKRISIKRFVN